MATTFGEIRTERQSFDPWGERRNPSTLALFRQTDTDPFRTSSEDHDRGYTGHEQLDDSGLIHMNGRIYDPELGRMLSPDPFVQIPEYSQNFNRYSYVLNNPLNKTDPSGYSWLSEAFDKVGDWFSENWRTVVAIVVMAVLTIVSFGTLAAGAFAVGSAVLGSTATAAVTATAGAWAVSAVGGAFLGGIAGGLNAALAGGDLGDVLYGATIGGVSGALSGALAYSGADSLSHLAGQGLIEGAKNEAMGGKFQDGFISAVASGVANQIPYANHGTAGLVKAGVAGGTSSALGGGKFSNGAATASFQYLLYGGGAHAERYFRKVHMMEPGPLVTSEYDGVVAVDPSGSGAPGEYDFAANKTRFTYHSGPPNFGPPTDPFTPLFVEGALLGPVFRGIGAGIGWAYRGVAARFAAKNVAPRALTQADLGIKGTLQELKGTFSVTDGMATARVDMIRGDIANPFKVIENLSATARAQGASTLRIEATLANERLYNILQKRYGLVTEGSNDIITIPLK